MADCLGWKLCHNYNHLPSIIDNRRLVKPRLCVCVCGNAPGLRVSSNLVPSNMHSYHRPSNHSLAMGPGNEYLQALSMVLASSYLSSKWQSVMPAITTDLGSYAICQLRENGLKLGDYMLSGVTVSNMLLLCRAGIQGK